MHTICVHVQDTQLNTPVESAFQGPVAPTSRIVYDRRIEVKFGTYQPILFKWVVTTSRKFNVVVNLDVNMLTVQHARTCSMPGFEYELGIAPTSGRICGVDTSLFLFGWCTRRIVEVVSRWDATAANLRPTKYDSLVQPAPDNTRHHHNGGLELGAFRRQPYIIKPAMAKVYRLLGRRNRLFAFL